jgi:hypothetical protein
VTWQEFVASAQAWQESIAALIGFTGVIITLVINAKIQRQHQEDVEEENKASLRSAIVAEFAILEEALSGIISQFDKEDSNYIKLWIPNDPLRSFVFGENTNLGILGPLVARSTIKAKLGYEQLYREYEIAAIDNSRKFHFQVSLEKDSHLMRRTDTIRNLLIESINTLNAYEN